MNGDAPGVGVLLCHQELGDIDKVVEGIAAFFQLTVQVPLVPHFITPAHVGDGENHPPVQQR